jgi:hypothetical protein
MESGDSPIDGSPLLLQSEPRERAPSLAQVRELGGSGSPSSQSRKNDASSSSPGSGNTVRPRSSGKTRNSPMTKMIIPESSSASTSRSRTSREGASGVVSSPAKLLTTSPESNSSGSDPSVDLSVHAARHSSSGDGDLWRLSSSRSPRSAEVICPVDIQWLQERLKLDEDTVSSSSIS